MAKKNPQSDVNITAFDILRAVTGQTEGKPAKKKATPEKNPAAVSLGRLGGLKGGQARAAKLSPKKRRQIATNAARARWKNA